MGTLYNPQYDVWVFEVLERIVNAQESGLGTLILKDLRININNETYPIFEEVLKILVDKRLIKSYTKDINEGEPVLKINLYKIKIDDQYKTSFCYGEVRQRGAIPAIRRSGDIINLTKDIIRIKKGDNLFVLVDNLFVLVWAEDIIMTECEKADLKEALKEDIFLTAEQTLRCQLVDRILKDGELFDDNCLSHLQGPTFHSDFED